jgi:hypothetical protein
MIVADGWAFFTTSTVVTKLVLKEGSIRTKEKMRIDTCIDRIG